MFDLPPPDPGIEFVVASRGMSKGIAQTEGPQVVVKPFVQMGPVQLGAQWKNVSSAVAGGESAIFANASPKLGRWPRRGCRSPTTRQCPRRVERASAAMRRSLLKPYW